MKNTISIKFLLIICTILFGCNRPTNKPTKIIQRDSLIDSEKVRNSFNKRSNLTNEIKIDSSFKLNFINPPKVFGFGGGGVFTYDTTELVNKKFIFISSLNEDSALVKINNKELILTPHT